MTEIHFFIKNFVYPSFVAGSGPGALFPGREGEPSNGPAGGCPIS